MTPRYEEHRSYIFPLRMMYPPMVFLIVVLLSLLSAFALDAPFQNERALKKELCPDGSEPLEGYFSYEVVLEGFEHNCKEKDLEKMDEKIEDTVLNVENRLSNEGQGTEIIIKDCDTTFKPWRSRNLKAGRVLAGRYTRTGGGFCRRCPNSRRILGKNNDDEKAKEKEAAIKAQLEEEEQKEKEEEARAKEKEEEAQAKEKLEQEKQKQADKEEELRAKEKEDEEMQKQAEIAYVVEAEERLQQIEEKLEQMGDIAGQQKLKDFLKRFEMEIAAGIEQELSRVKCISYDSVKVEVMLLLSEDQLPCSIK